MECRKYRGVKLYELLLEKRMRDMIAIVNYQLGFCQGRSTARAMFILREVQSKE